MRISLQTLDLPVDRIEAPLVVVPFFCDRRPLDGPAALLDWRMNGFLTQQILDGRTSGNFGERFLVKSNHKISAEWVMFVGCGSGTHDEPFSRERVINQMLSSVVSAGFKRVGLGLPVASREQLPAWKSSLEACLSASEELRHLRCQYAACDPAAYIQ